MAKQTSIEYAVDKLENLIPPGNQMIIRIIIEQAKAMHKEEMCQFVSDYLDDAADDMTAEEYYDQIYGGNNE